MALRLTTSTPVPDPAGAAADADGSVEGRDRRLAEIHRLAGEAGDALDTPAGPQVDAYRRLFARADALTDPQDRYRARKLLVERALLTARDRADDRAAAVLAAAAAGVVDALSPDPAEPVLLNYAGVIFHELWALDAARALFTTARRLDPALPHVERNLESVRDRTRHHGGRHPLTHPAVGPLARQATAIARRAQPAQGLRISLCMIVRDEAEMLPRSLEAIRDAVDEIIVVDTGSTDDTVQIARSFGARVIEREWTGSFSDARNVSLDAATGDWLLYLDADEVLVRDDAQKLRDLAGHTWREAYFLQETNYTGTEDQGIAIAHTALRLFRNRPDRRFRGRLHEQIAHTLPGDLPERFEHTNVRIDHFGYLGVVRDAKQKSRRNIELLRAQEASGETDAFFHFNLACELFAVGDLAQALPQFERAQAIVDAKLGRTRYEFGPTLALRTVKVLRGLGRHEQAIARAADALPRFPGFTDLVLEQALASLALGREPDGVRLLEQCVSMGDAPARYTALVGCGTFRPRIVLAERHLRRGESAEALALLRWCAEHHPGTFELVHPYATALLRSGVDPEQVVATFAGAGFPLTATARFMVGTALFEQGHAAAAGDQFAAVLQSKPHSTPARVALAEALLYQRRYREGAHVAAQVDHDDRLAAAAARSELFGLLAGGEVDSALTTLPQMAGTRLPAAEQAVFGAWATELADAPAEPVAVPAAGAPLAELMLESFLRVQDFENFERLLPVYARMPLPARERRERLAQMYLRRGFLRSAAREWMAVCEERPDPTALAGLAQVARANGQPDAAAALAAEALALDPSNTAAQALAG